MPDYSVKATGDVIILRIRRTLYQAAVQATILEKTKKGVKDLPQDALIDKQIEDVSTNIATADMGSKCILTNNMC